MKEEDDTREEKKYIRVGKRREIERKWDLECEMEEDNKAEEGRKE